MTDRLHRRLPGPRARAWAAALTVGAALVAVPASAHVVRSAPAHGPSAATPAVAPADAQRVSAAAGENGPARVAPARPAEPTPWRWPFESGGSLTLLAAAAVLLALLRRPRRDQF